MWNVLRRHIRVFLVTILSSLAVSACSQVPCISCGGPADLEYRTVNGDVLCDNCAHNDYYRCPNCEKYFCTISDDYIWPYCPDCTIDFSSSCDICGAAYLDSDLICIEDYHICKYCMEAYLENNEATSSKILNFLKENSVINH